MMPTEPPATLTQMKTNPAERPLYSLEELRLYFERISLPQSYWESPVLQAPSLAATSEHGLPLLRVIHRRHLVSIPFDNVAMHYSDDHKISLDMSNLYEKIVSQGINTGRGGHCMEHNGFFGTVLRSLGYDVMNCCGRVSRMMKPSASMRQNQGDTYDPWNHMMNLVKIEATWWVVDVGMGAWGPCIVYPLKDGFESVSLPPRRIRLQHRVIPEHSAKDKALAPKLWCYDVCHQDDVWIPTYCFTETEFLPQDYEMMSWFVSTSPSSFFARTVICTKLLLDSQGEHVVGDVTLFGSDVRRTIGGKREIVEKLQTEEDRVRALREIFGEKMTDIERDGIDVARI